MQVREKVGKSRFTVFFQWFVVPEGRKVGSLKRRVGSHLAKWEMNSCTPWRREAHFQVKKLKTPHGRSTFGSWDVERAHAVVARSTFPSQSAQNTSVRDRFWKLTCRKSGRRCGAQHISKSKRTKHTQVRSTFWSWHVEKVHAVVAWSTFQSQNVKRHQMFGPLLDVQMSFCLAGARDCAPCQKRAKRNDFVAVSTTTTTTLHTTPLHYITPQLQLQLQLHLHYTIAHYTTLITSNYITLHYTPLDYITLPYT